VRKDLPPLPAPGSLKRASETRKAGNLFVNNNANSNDAGGNKSPTASGSFPARSAAASSADPAGAAPRNRNESVALTSNPLFSAAEPAASVLAPAPAPTLASPPSSPSSSSAAAAVESPVPSPPPPPIDEEDDEEAAEESKEDSRAHINVTTTAAAKEAGQQADGQKKAPPPPSDAPSDED